MSECVCDVDVLQRVVRCKDCRWACVPDDDGGYGDCVLACAWWMDYSRSVSELFVGKDDFCSNGETRRAHKNGTD